MTRLIIVFFILSVASGSVYALECSNLKHITSFYFRQHFSQQSFDDDLSQRTLDMFLKTWDPGKLYFLKGDIDSLNKSYSDKLDDMVAKGDCSAITQVMTLYSKRYEERMILIKKLIDSEHDFTKDEYLNIDRKNEDFAATLEEVNERWRKRIKFQVLELKKSTQNLKDSRDKLHKRYHLQAKRHNELTTNDVYDSFLNSFSLALDPHSSYFSPESLEDFRINTSLSLEGIGAALRSEDGFTKIQSLMLGGAAEKTKLLRAEDKIIAVGQSDGPPVDVIDMDLRDVVKMIRGPRGTEVRLTIIREEKGETQKLIVPVIREKVELKDRGAKSYVFSVDAIGDKNQKQALKIGVIDLPSFYIDFEGRQNRKSDYKSSSEDVKKELVKLNKQKIDALIVDLRNNGGGSLDESIKLAGFFIEEGPVVQVRNTDGSGTVHNDEDKGIQYTGPLVVMINRHSASASEIFAGAIKDYGRGVIIGDEHTFGKGTVQTLSDLSPTLGAVKITISKFYRPSGSSTQMKGVDSDIVFPSLLDQYEVGEKHYDYALAWSKIEPAKFKPLEFVTPHIAPLKKASETRIKSDKDFAELLAEIKKYKENEQDRYRVSLKEEKKDDKKGDKTADKGAKSPDEEEEIEPESSLSDDPIKNLKRDIYLQETLRVAADYHNLINKKSLPKELRLVDLDSLAIADNNKTIKAKEDVVEVKGKDVKDSNKK